MAPPVPTDRVATLLAQLEEPERERAQYVLEYTLLMLVHMPPAQRLQQYELAEATLCAVDDSGELDFRGVARPPRPSEP